jgi:hypothetical protein
VNLAGVTNDLSQTQEQVGKSNLLVLAGCVVISFEQKYEHVAAFHAFVKFG